MRICLLFGVVWLVIGMIGFVFDYQSNFFFMSVIIANIWFSASSIISGIEKF